MLGFALAVLASCPSRAADDAEAGEDPKEDLPAAGEAPGEWLMLTPPPPLPSALDTIVEDHADEGPVPDLAALSGGIPELLRATVRTRWFVRPRAAIDVLSGTSRVRPNLGIALGHQWWTFIDVPVAPAGETGLVAMLPLGSPNGL